MKLVHLFVLIFLSLFIACEEDNYMADPFFIVRMKEDSMPIYTERGQNMLAYKVDGRVVYTKNEIDSSSTITAFRLIDPITNKWIFFLEGHTIRRDNFESVRITLDEVVDTGLYLAKESNEFNNNQIQYIRGPNALFNIAYVTTDEYLGYVYIHKLDTINNIISGKFYFKAKRFLWPSESDTVNITEGWFDVRNPI